MADSQREQRLKYELLIPIDERRQADGLHELQLSPRSFRRALGHPAGMTAAMRYQRLRRLWPGAHRPGAVPASRAGPGAVAGRGHARRCGWTHERAVDLRAAAARSRDCDWPITNCYVDAWMLISAPGARSAGRARVTVAQDYEGDQFTFFKYLHEDLEHLYGVVVGELIDLASSGRADRGADADWPRCAGGGGRLLSAGHARHVYRTQHTKTTIAIDSHRYRSGAAEHIFTTPASYELTGQDYAGVFRQAARAGSGGRRAAALCGICPPPLGADLRVPR